MFFCKGKDGKGLLFLFILLILAIGAWWMSSSKPKILDNSNIKYIADFDSGNDPNLVGGKHFIEKSLKATCEASYFNEITSGANKGSNSGYSLKINYNVPVGEFVKIGVDFNGLDISKAEKFCFSVRGAKGGESFELNLVDKEGHRNKIKINKVSSSWKKFEFDTSDFEDIDFGQLDYCMFDFTKANFANQGEIFVDDIFFYSSHPDIFMTSLLDNIAGIPQKKLADKSDVKDLLSLNNKEFIRNVAKDTWQYFRDAVDQKNHLVLDFMDVDTNIKIGDYTSVTNLGLYFMCVISAYDLNFITKEAAIEKINNTLKVLEHLPRWKGQWYNYYSTTNLQIGRYFVSSVDNGWLAAGLIVARNTFPEVYEKCTTLLSGMDFSLFYNETLGQIKIGYQADKLVDSPYNYGVLCAEPRIVSFIGIGKGDIPREHWFRVYRTLPESWSWQNQKPQGVEKTNLGVKYFQGYYKAMGQKLVPSWGGSMFEFLMPTLVMKEQALAPKSFGLNNKRAVDMQIKYALSQKQYPVWGISPCSTPMKNHGGYYEFGIKELGAKGYEDEGVITPHASFLALAISPDEAIENLKNMLKLYPVYGQYGFYDSVDVKNDVVSYKYMALDQGMSLVAMDNYLNNDIMNERFHKDPYVKKAEALLGMEEFF